MAVNKPTGDSAPKSAVRRSTDLVEPKKAERLLNDIDDACRIA